jgi:hypothetical protein
VKPNNKPTSAYRRPLRPLLLLPLLALLPLTLSGCATKIRPVEISASRVNTAAACRVLKPVTWSKRDTRETIDGVRKNNAARAKVCR